MDSQQNFEREDYIMRRSRAPPTNAAVFIETNDPVGGALGACAPASVYIDSLGRFGSIAEARKQDQINIAMWKEADEEINQLFALMVQCTWEQVMGEVQSLATRWSTSPKKSSKMMICLEKLGQNSDAFKSWLELLPAGDYGSSICGVFTIALGAVGAFSKVEAVILETLAEIPETMDEAKRYIDIYGRCREPALEKKTFELYLSILTALRHIMQFFVDSSWSKVYQPILKQSSYKNELLESCETIRRRASRVKNEANICMQRRFVELDQAIRLQNNDSNENADQTFATLDNMFYKLFLSFESRFVQLLEQKDLNVRTMQAIQNEKLVEEQRERDVEQAFGLLETLGYNPDIVLDDTEMCLRLGAALDEAEMARAAAFVNNPTFKAFMTQDTSSALLVNGNEDLSNAEGVSPLSLVAARLAQISEQNIMMANLLGQLISHMLSRSVEVNLSPLRPGDSAALQRRDLKVMCTVFFELVKQLPPKTILLCILDEVALYETGE
ncbi:hypothetical protein UCDDA912_g04340 [Diaporthe ampelina]|uniref:Uncharacterized protein n=1 Tax=Diaporthe ampelina TaxID=1214573 RepID=A0A0G2FMZ5_9PEZI|nr:hypothetical protein UCDDA912_g04340 [Diaporthe ampelina]